MRSRAAIIARRRIALAAFPAGMVVVLIDATTGDRRELTRSDQPFEPEWMGRAE